MTFVTGMQCRECGKQYDKKPFAVCSDCFGPLEITYDYAGIGKAMTKQVIQSRPPTMWRYRELMPIDGDPGSGLMTGFTPLVQAKALGKALGFEDLWLKNDAVNAPTLSFKDRVVATAISKAKEFGFTTVGCASTGNLANATAAQAAAAGLKAVILVPRDLEAAKIEGTLVFGPTLVGIEGHYDQVNRLCAEIADKHGWAFVNVNLRAYYGEGSKSMGYEIAEQLGWRLPDQVVVPMAGGSLITKIGKSFSEFTKLGLVKAHPVKLFGAQGAGCQPIVNAVEGYGEIRPVKPNTIAKSLAIGTPADGFYAARDIKASGGWAAGATDDEIRDGMELLARTEGIFAETAGGVTVAAARKMKAQGKLSPQGTTVLCITGNGLKTLDALSGRLSLKHIIKPGLAEFERLWASIA